MNFNHIREHDLVAIADRDTGKLKEIQAVIGDGVLTIIVGDGKVFRRSDGLQVNHPVAFKLLRVATIEDIQAVKAAGDARYSRVTGR